MDTVSDVAVDGMTKAVTVGAVESTQVLLLCVYPVLQEATVQVPYDDQAPVVVLQVLVWEPVPLVIVQDWVAEPEHESVIVTASLSEVEMFPAASITQA